MQVDNKPCYVNVCEGAGMGLHKTDKMFFIFCMLNIFYKCNFIKTWTVTHKLLKLTSGFCAHDLVGFKVLTSAVYITAEYLIEKDYIFFCAKENEL